MSKNSLLLFSALFLPYCLYSAEPSAFGAGKLDNPTPYGLTSSEKVILQNKKNLRKVEVKSNNQANEVDSIRERIDGLQTLIESLNISSRDNKLELKSLKQKNIDQLKGNNEYEKRLIELIQVNSDLAQENGEFIIVNTKEINKLKLLTAEISKLVDKINIAYVTKNEFNLLVDDVNKFKDLVAKEFIEKEKSQKKLHAKLKQSKSKLDDIPNSEIAKRAKNYYNKKFYTKALKYYNHLINKNYKPAQAHYMIGEIKYYRKSYSDAIAYFKKSASIYSKASYMPTLLLHTAISMDKTGDKINAETFYNAVITKYPQSNSAQIAKSNLDLIQ
ncbi:MAG: tetratricopeptide repeat protein [Sulfurimonas sp.]|nr:tetratricopeptide repeat protein [Sulfurimonas sp.]